MKARDESGINKDFPEKSTYWNATDGKRCTDVVTAACHLLVGPSISCKKNNTPYASSARKYGIKWEEPFGAGPQRTRS